MKPHLFRVGLAFRSGVIWSWYWACCLPSGLPVLGGTLQRAHRNWEAMQRGVGSTIQNPYWVWVRDHLGVQRLVRYDPALPEPPIQMFSVRELGHGGTGHAPSPVESLDPEPLARLHGSTLGVHSSRPTISER